MIFINQQLSKIERITLIHFFRFLKLKKIYSDFFYYANNHIKERNGCLEMHDKKIENINDVLIALTIYSPQRLISAFPWSDTKEGFEYWSSICCEWGEIFYRIKKIIKS